MSNLTGYIKCYDTLSREYVFVQVPEEIESFIKRSYWREDMQNRRYDQRIVELESITVNKEDLYHEVHSMANGLINEFEIEILKGQITKLDKRYREIVYLVYYEGLSLSAAAQRLGISTSYMSRLMKKVKEILKNKLIELELE